MNTQGRPTRSDATATSMLRQNVHRQAALDMEEALIFEIRSAGRRAASISRPAAVRNAARPRPGKATRPAGALRARDGAALRATVAQELRDRRGALSAGSCTMKHNPRLNEKMARLARLRRRASLAASLHRSGRAQIDQALERLFDGDDRHERGGDVAEGRRAWRAMRHDGDQGGNRGAWQRATRKQLCFRNFDFFWLAD